MKLRSIAALYMQSPQWGNLKPNSKRIYLYGMGRLERFMKMEANHITRPMIIDFRDKYYDQTGICRIALSALNTLLSWGYDRGYVEYNHAKGIKHLPKQKPFKKWTDDEVKMFLDGSPLHLKRAVMMALYTGQRRIDLIRMRWDQYDGQYIHLVQVKTGKPLILPVHPELKEELDRMRSEVEFPKAKTRYVVPPYILLNSYGQPWTLKQITAAITKQTKKLGIEDRKLHGLRKTTASRLAELGCSPHEIAAITGQSMSEVEHYAKEASQARMARNAMKKWSEEGRV